jgi:MFS superfamily sulfate permease-like transporter
MISINGSCTFSNWISFESKLNKIPDNANVTIDAKNAKFLDHTFMENILHVQDERMHDGGTLTLIGNADMRKLSSDNTSGRIR